MSPKDMPNRGREGAISMATMRDVADLAGVSAKTVSRVFNNDPHVTPETKARVEAALRELSYVPNSIATTFRTGRAPVIGVAVPDILDPFFASIAHAAEILAADRGMSVVITGLGSPDREPEAVQALLRQALSGLVIASVSLDHSYLAAWTERTNIVFVDRPPVGIAADSFIEDDIGGASLATTHLIEHGHSRIGFIGDDLDVPTTRARLDGYRAALVAAGIADDDELVGMGAFDRAGAAEALATIDHAAPTAVFCSNARAAMGLAPILQDSGLAITTFGDFPFADMLTPSWTVIDQDPVKLGSLAAKRVLDRLDKPNRRYRRRTVLPVDLVERDSCRVKTRLAAARDERYLT